MSLLKLEHLSAGYGKKTIISEISLSVEKGQMVGILGPNGCGKSTLMKAVCKGIPYQGGAKLYSRSDRIQVKGP